MSKRYTAVIKLIRVEDVPPPPRGNVPGSEVKTRDVELANLVVRNTSLSNLIKAVKGHIDLVEESE